MIHALYNTRVKAKLGQEVAHSSQHRVGVDSFYLFQPVPLLSSEVVVEPFANALKGSPNFLLRASVP